MDSLSLKSRVWTVLGAILLAPGCSQETGILVVVDRDDTVPVEIDHVEFSIGVAGAVADEFLLDQSSSIEVPMQGRDLKITPYELLIHPTNLDTSIIVVVTAWDAQGQVVGFGALDTPQPFFEGKVLMSTITLTGFFDGSVLDTGCVKFYPPDGGGVKIIIAPATDRDCDGDAITDVPPDCNDTNPSIGPSASEICETTDVDEDCDGDPIEDVDADTDGQSRCLGDCNDSDPEVNSLPETFERCDGKDNDCNFLCDDGDAFDFDGDGFTICNSVPQLDGTCTVGVECDDLVASTHGGAHELCDGVDNDCNEVCDDGAENDVDGDGFTPCGTIVGTCGDPTPQLVDCEPGLEWAHPFADELCDGVDTNCDGFALETTPCFLAEAGMDPAACTEGVAACDDNGEDGSFGLLPCAHAPTGYGNPALAGLCDGYVSCWTAGDLDPWTCSLEAAPAIATATCSVKVTGPLLQTCTSNTATLMGEVGGLGCSWWIYGGTEQDHYDVGMSNLSSPAPSGSVAGCTGTFHVTGKNDPVPQPDSVWLGYTQSSDTTIQLIRVDLMPVVVASCPPANALECTIAIP